MRWLRHRIRLATRALKPSAACSPGHFLGCAATVPAFRARLGTDAAFARLREIVAPKLPALPTLLGFAHHAGGVGNPPAVQQRAGHDPPATPA